MPITISKIFKISDNPNSELLDTLLTEDDDPLVLDVPDVEFLEDFEKSFQRN